MYISGRFSLSNISVSLSLVLIIPLTISPAFLSSMKRYWLAKSLSLVMLSSKLNVGFTAAWFNFISLLKYALPVFWVEAVTPPRIGMKRNAVITVNIMVVVMAIFLLLMAGMSRSL